MNQYNILIELVSNKQNRGKPIIMQLDLESLNQLDELQTQVVYLQIELLGK